MSRLLAITIILLAAAPAAQAISRHSAMELSCDEITAIIRREGAAIFRYPSPRRTGLTLYDRYVRNGNYCATHQITEKVRIPAAEGGQCLVQHCVTRPDRCHGLRCF